MNKKKILYFEDEWMARYLIEGINALTPWTIKNVTTPTAFLEALRNDPPYDLFILKVITPMVQFTEQDILSLTDSQQRRLENGMRVGIVFAEMIREKYSDTPIIFLTTQHIKVPDNNSRLILKPAFFDHVEKTIKELLSIE